MSTNVAHNPQGAGRHYTVAELVARERAAAVRARATQRIHQPMSEPTRRIAPVGTPAGSESDQQGMHVTELLRREGVDYGEDSESAETPPPALAAKTPKDRSRVAMVSRAAVLFGLTVGGMVGLQSTVANAPDQSPGPVDSGGAIAAPQQIEPRSSTSETGAETKQEQKQNQEPSGGGASPTTSADVVLHDNASELPAQAPAGGAGAAASTAGDGAAHTPAPAPTTTQAPAPTSAGPQPDSTAPQQEQQEQQQQDRSATQQDTQQDTQEQQSSQPEEGSSTDGDDDGILDPVTGVVSGVLDAGTGLLGG